MYLLGLLVAYAAVATAAPRGSYSAQRRAFRTKIRDTPRRRFPAPPPPPEIYEKIKYAAPLGNNTAYVTPLRRDGKKRPAIVWIHGGFDWGIDASAWEPAPRTNDQSARAFREAGLVEVLPSLRGCDDNPGGREYFLGEVDDVLAAIDYVRKRADVDPTRVYLGGHSTGGTLALLVAASRPPVRAVFAFGPIARIDWYGPTGTALADADADEVAMRSPATWLSQVTAPVFVIEGEARGNAASFEPLRAAAGKAPVRFLLVPGATHFSTLAPITELIAARVMREADTRVPFRLDETDLAAAFAAH
jgi:dipeptidyl aminopeptidase/acylaminoacyl peptidase